MMLSLKKPISLLLLLIFSFGMTSCLEDESTEDRLASFSDDNIANINDVYYEYISALEGAQLDSFDVGDKISYTRSFVFQGNQYTPYQTITYILEEAENREDEPDFVYYTFSRRIKYLIDDTPDEVIEMYPYKIGKSTATLLKQLKEKKSPAISLHNLKITKEVLQAPNSSKNKGVCNHLPNDCTYKVTNISYDMVDWDNNYSIKFEFRISPDLPFLLFEDPSDEIESHMGLPMLGIASVCKQFWRDFNGNQVYTSDCLGLKEFEFGPEGNM